MIRMRYQGEWRIDVNSKKIPPMKLQELILTLQSLPTNTKISFTLPNGEEIPNHYHITEIGRSTKDFFDCGGIRRQEHRCTMQLWVAHDIEHGLTAGKIVKILNYSQELFSGQEGEMLPIEIEYQETREHASTQIFTITSTQKIFNKQIFALGVRKTDCLAPDRCGVKGDCC
jgi:hypothetical protein